MFVKELGKKAGVPSVYTLPFCMLGQWKTKKIYKSLRQGIAQAGRALSLMGKGQRFKSFYLDQTLWKSEIS